MKSTHDTKVVCISASLLLWSYRTQDIGLTSLFTSDASCSVTSLLLILRNNKKPLTYLSLPKDPTQWRSFTRLLPHSGPQRPHPDLTCWDTHWLPARLCTHWSFLRSRVEEGSSAMPRRPAGVVPTVPRDLGYGTLEVVLDRSNRDCPFSPAFFS